MRLWDDYNRIIMLAVAIGTLATAAPGCRAFRKDGINANGSFLGINKKQKKEKSTDYSQEYLDPLGARDANRLMLVDLAPSQIATTFKTRWMSDTNSSMATTELTAGKKIYSLASEQQEANPTSEAHVDQFNEAANRFRVASANAPDAQVEEEALYLEGEAYFFANRYVQSNRAFEKLIAKFPGTRFLELAEQKRFAIAQYWLELSENGAKIAFNDPQRPRTGIAGEARRILHRIRVDDPTGKYADDATMALGQAFLRAKNYYEAADTFQDIRTNYPGSKHQFNAHMLELQARLQGYQGPSYDATPLKAADKLLDQIVRKFPKESQEQLGYLEEQATKIRNQLAERDYSLGEYYAQRGQNRAAKMAYERVAQNYSETQFGRSVADRIADVSSKPPVPAQHAEWLVNLFPEDKTARPVIASRDDRIVR